MPRLDNTEVVFHGNIVNNDYQQDLRALYTFILNKLFGQVFLVNKFSPKNIIFLEAFHSDFHLLKYGLLIKIVIRYREKIEEISL